MTRSDMLTFLIQALMPGAQVPERENDLWTMFRSLVNLRQPGPVSGAFLRVQDALLQAETARKGITQLCELEPMSGSLYLWRGDITTLAVDAIVNAANSGMTGCYCPCHGCIDNAIHTYAGVQLRNACAEIMKRQGHAEPTGTAKLTKAYNLPCRFVLHTVGPIVDGPLTRRHKEQLASCYRACLALARQSGLSSIAFCCISTGEFHFPNREAAQIAIRTVRDFLNCTGADMKVIFNVFTAQDLQIYQAMLS